jgi:hypothetical protein
MSVASNAQLGNAPLATPSSTDNGYTHPAWCAWFNQMGQNVRQLLQLLNYAIQMGGPGAWSYPLDMRAAVTGSASVTNGSADVVGLTGPQFTLLAANTIIEIGGVNYTVSSVTDALHLTLTGAYSGTTSTGVVWSVGVAQAHIASGPDDDGLYLMALSPNAGYLTVAAAWDGAAWIAKAAVATGLVFESTGVIHFFQNSGLTAGVGFAPTFIAEIDASGNFNLLTSGATLTAPLLAATTSVTAPTINATTHFQANGTNGASGSSTYVKTVDFTAKTVTTGTVTVSEGIITAIT